YHCLLFQIYIAAVQLVLTSGAGTGFITTIGSYDKLHNNCLFDAFIMVVFNLIYPFIYGIFLMAFAGLLSMKLGEDVGDFLYTHFELGKMPLALSMIPGHFLWVFLYALMNFMGKFVFY
ncbi:unnamed protein product, partial [Meganyctiphanes norvegica]